MAYSLPKLTNVLSLLKKLYSQDHSCPCPAAAAAVSVFDQNSPAYCSICLNDICRGDTHRKLPQCMHSFHSRCIDAWFESHSTCPLCRIEVPPINSSIGEAHKKDLLGDFVSNFASLFEGFLEKFVDPGPNAAMSLLMYGEIRSGV
ncbi:probable E3 ubiquitin-protein ligase ATL45 [Henckelia pumila]|uniref:probable E3 ubiquitin-protein ligase ATL45 n=1 Tax=Henckelia pumila TaxID=405737 RepID=UPI003C6E6DD7